MEIQHAILGNNHVFHQGALVQVCRSKWYNDTPVTLVKTRKEESFYLSFCRKFFIERAIPFDFPEQQFFPYKWQAIMACPPKSTSKRPGVEAFLPFVT